MTIWNELVVMEGEMPSNEPEARPLIEFRVGLTPAMPTVAVIEVTTHHGSDFYAVEKVQMQQMVSDPKEIIDVIPDTPSWG